MRLDSRPRILTYVGSDRGMLDMLARCLDGTTYRIEHRLPSDWSLHVLAPSWRCERVVLFDHFESPETQGRLEELARFDAGIPVVVLLDGLHATSLTFAGLARLHGADRVVLKPVNDPASLAAAIGRAFARLDHWRARFDQPCFLVNVDPTSEAFAASPLRTSSEVTWIDPRGAPCVEDARPLLT